LGTGGKETYFWFGGNFEKGGKMLEITVIADLSHLVPGICRCDRDKFYDDISRPQGFIDRGRLAGVVIGRTVFPRAEPLVENES
jgi:hypothetical protein